eukprot:4190666-Prymnesium_polylepis.1
MPWSTGDERTRRNRPLYNCMRHVKRTDAGPAPVALAGALAGGGVHARSGDPRRPPLPRAAAPWPARAAWWRLS